MTSIADCVASGRGYRCNEQTQTVSRVEASPTVAAGLGVEEGVEVYVLARLVKEGEQPTHTLTGAAAVSDEAKLLQLPSGEPVVELHRTTCTASGTVVEFAIGVHAASRFAWEYDFKVPDSARDGEARK